MDDLDVTILHQLAADARTPLARIAATVEVSTATIHQRVRRLRDRGVIRGYRLDVDWDAVGLPVSAIVSLQVGDAAGLGATAREISQVRWVESCSAVTGEFDLMAVVRARSSAHLGEVLDDLRRRIPGASRTVVVLTSYFSGRLLPLGESHSP